MKHLGHETVTFRLMKGYSHYEYPDPAEYATVPADFFIGSER